MAFGLFYASGVFIAEIDNALFTLSMGIAGFCIALGITFFGIVMNRLIPASHAVLAPVYIACVGAFGLLAQVVMPRALATDDAFMLFGSAVCVGLGSGAIYLASVDVLQAWVPEAPGLITGLGMLCGGVGSLLGIRLDIMLTHLLGGPLPALGVIGAVTGFIALASAFVVRRPPPDWNPKLTERPGIRPTMNDECGIMEPCSDSELDRLLSPSNSQLVLDPPYLTVKDIITDRSFYLLLVAFAGAVGPGFGFVLAFQRMGYILFGISMEKANRLFFWVTMAGVAGRLLTGWTVDKLRSLEPESKDHLHGERKTNLILLAVQTVAFLTIPISIHTGFVYVFTIAAAAVYVTFSGGVVVAACMVRGIFMPQNASLAFSLVAISIGVGDIFFSWIVAYCGALSDAGKNFAPTISSAIISGSHKGDYNLFLLFGVLWSLCGLAASLYVGVSSKVRVTDSIVGASTYEYCD